MVDDALPGGSAGHPARGFLLPATALRRAAAARGLLAGGALPGARVLFAVAGCLMLSFLASIVLVIPAEASTLYRCVGSTGETVLSDGTHGYKDCKRIGSTPAARPSPRPVAATAKSAVFEAVEAAPSLKGVIGSVVLAPGVNDIAGPAAPVRMAGEGVPQDSSVGWAAAPSIKGVIGTVILAPSVFQPMLAGVMGGVVADDDSVAPEPMALPPVTAPKGQWDYRESASTDLATTPAPAAPQGSRVLRGAVYRITRADGGVEYTNIPQAGAARGASVKMLFTYIATCAACDVHSKVNWNAVALNITAFGDAIRAASNEFSVDEALLRAVIHAESAFNPRALSIAGAQGLMQLIPGTARDMGVLDAFDANQNIRGGARYLALLLRTFNGNERLAAAAYNAGPGAVQKYNGVPPYDETQVYVERVGVLRKRYQEMLRSHPVERGPLAAREF